MANTYSLLTDFPVLGVFPDLLFSGLSWFTYKDETESGRKIILQETTSVVCRAFKVASLMALFALSTHPLVALLPYLVFGAIQAYSQQQANYLAQVNNRLCTRPLMAIAF